MGLHIIFICLVVITCFHLSESGLTTEEELGVEPILGAHGYVAYYPGNINLIFSSPHGGTLKPEDIPLRKGPGVDLPWQRVVLERDMASKEIAIGVAKQFQELTGRRPHLIINNLHRNRLDPNAEKNTAAQNNTDMETAFDEYHQFITDASLTAAPPTELKISSTGPAGKVQSMKMGEYYKSTKIYNNFPVYTKFNSNSGQEVFVRNGKWVVGKIGGYRSLVNGNGLTATPPRDGWKFWDGKSWKDDSKLKVEPPFALLLDFHVQVHEGNRTELGYGPSKYQLNQSCTTCEAEKTYIRSLIKRTGIPLLQMLHGPHSLGAMFNDAGYNALPSPEQEKPGDEGYFNGGMTVYEHGSKEGGPVDAIQMEFPGSLTWNHYGIMERDRFISSLAHVIQRFYLQFYDNEYVFRS